MRIGRRLEAGRRSESYIYKDKYLNFSLSTNDKFTIRSHELHLYVYCCSKRSDFNFKFTSNVLKNRKYVSFFFSISLGGHFWC